MTCLSEGFYFQIGKIAAEAVVVAGVTAAIVVAFVGFCFYVRQK